MSHLPAGDNKLKRKGLESRQGQQPLNKRKPLKLNVAPPQVGATQDDDETLFCEPEGLDCFRPKQVNSMTVRVSKPVQTEEVTKYCLNDASVQTDTSSNEQALNNMILNLQEQIKRYKTELQQKAEQEEERNCIIDELSKEIHLLSNSIAQFTQGN